MSFLLPLFVRLKGQQCNLTYNQKSDNLKTLTLDLKEDFLANLEQGVEQYLGFEFALPTL